MPTTVLLTDPDRAGRITGPGEVRVVETRGLTAERLQAAVREADCAVIDAAVGEGPSLARRVHAADPAVQLVMVTAPEERRALERALLFSPGLGEVWLAVPDQLDAALLERACEVTRQRRHYRSTRRQLQADLGATESQRRRRALISDAYLAALLQVLPDPVVSVDEEGRVLSWNPAAEQLLGYPAAEALGRDFLEVVRTDDRDRLSGLLDAGRVRPQAGEIGFRDADGQPGVAELAVVPVEAAGHRVRSVVMHDVSEARRARSELQEQAAELQEQAAELEMLNTELHERSLQLEEAMAARNRFYAAMSHELRTPMNAIIGFNSLLLQGIYGPLPPPQEAALLRSQKAAEHLLELVNDVLDLAKIEAGRIEMEPAEAAFPLLLQEILQTVRPLAEEHGTELVLEERPGDHVVRTDPRRVRQILLNLLSNAIKFGRGEPVVVSWAPTEDGGLRIDVTDRGPGIAPEDQARIFDEFVQLGGREWGGTGLGLPISRRLAQLLGGSLELSSAPGRGSTFRLVLPPRLPQAGGR